MEDKKIAFEAKAKAFFPMFAEKFSKSDKKTFKENLSPFFGTGETVSDFVTEPYPRYEEKAPDKWNEWFKLVNMNGEC